MNEDEIMELDFRDTVTRGLISRRAFLKGLGGGIIILISLDIPSVLAAQAGRREQAADFNAYLRIGPDGRVTGFSGKIEMGQGIITSLAQMLADELDVSVESVDMVMGDTALCPWDMGTFGSMSTRFFGPALRAAAAEARGVLIELAAEHLGVPKERLQTKDGVVFDKTQESDAGHLRGARRRQADRAAPDGEGRPEIRIRVQGDGQAHAANGRPGQGHRRSQVCGRHPPARHAVRQGPQTSRPRREADRR